MEEQSPDLTPSLSMVDYEGSLKRLGGSVELFKELIKIFNTDGPVLLNQMAVMINDQDTAAVQRAAHSLKGLMSNFGATDCCQMAQQIETSCKVGDLENVKLLQRKLSPEVENLSVELNGFL